jgi:haloacetate dehalogenase
MTARSALHTLLPGFSDQRIVVADRTGAPGQTLSIPVLSAGSGPPLLLLHGHPQTRALWNRVAPRLAAHFTVVLTDLRGYGDADKPATLPDHTQQSFRAMAADQVEVMRALGFGRFRILAHDRGARTAHRMALDWPEQVRSLTVLDLVPTHALYNQTNKKIASTYWQWYFLPQPTPYPERLIGADPDYYFESCLSPRAARAWRHSIPPCWRNTGAAGAIPR